ncbi:MAG: hypothetical protein ABWZ53_08900, partial [Actinomycetota bacterium]
MFESRKAMAACAVGAIIAMSVASAATAQSPTSEEEPVTFTVGVTFDLNSANPFKQIDTAEAFLSGLMYDDLLTLGQQD